MSERHDTIWQSADTASRYGASRSSIPFADVHFEIVRRILDAADVRVETLLDLGAGDGLATAEVMKHQPVKAVTLTDFSEPMLSGAHQRFANTDLDVSYVIGDFRESDWHPQVEARGPFDAVISRFAIHHIPDEMKRALYGRILTWLKPGGMFVHIEHVASGSSMYNHAHDTLMVERLMATKDDHANFDEVFAGYRERADGGANILAPVWDQLAWLRELGYVDVDCAFKCFELSVFAGRRPA